MKKRARIAVLAIISVLVMMLQPMVGITTVKAAASVNVRIHYQRSDGNYDGWNIWCWPSTMDGSAYQFTGEDDFGKVADFKVDMPANDNKIGFIIRLSEDGNEWAAKDTDDCFVELENVDGSIVDIYVTSGKKEFDYEVTLGEVVPKVMYAESIDEKSIAFDLNVEEKAKNIKADLKYTDGTKIAIEEITMDGKKGTIKLKEDYDISKKLVLSIKNYGEAEVPAKNIFSTKKFEDQYTYNGTDLGATWTEQETVFKVWAPTADEVVLNLYKSGDYSLDDKIESIPMEASDAGTWVVTKTGDCNGIYYTYSVTVGGDTKEANDPYAKAVGVNGERAMVINLDATNPSNWENDKRITAEHLTDASIYELHIRDFSIDESSGMKNKGKYLAFTETGTKTSNGQPTGVDYLKQLGITHVQLMPSFDYASVDETKLDTPQFNWGYDPKNFNVPEGSYSTDPYNGEIRVNEYKQMVQSLHNNGLGVIMDVVYNHTSETDWCYNRIVPDYCYRADEKGVLSAGSGCGNDIASERLMLRKYIVDSVVYWATEYHIDGFRFDLVGLIDVDTMNAVREALDQIDPTILLYGEGWNLPTSVTKENTELSLQTNASKLTGMGFFSDNIRDSLKGSVFDSLQKGYINGATGLVDTIKDCVKGTQAWATNPTQAINYTSCHDNNTLWDKIASSNPEDSEEDRLKQNLLSAAIIYTSQGAPLIQAGEEMLRTKVNEDGTFNSNSYNASDFVNSIRWDRYSEYSEAYEYYKGLMAFRKEHSALRMTTKEEVDASIAFQDGLDDNVIAYTIAGGANNEASEGLFVVYNPNREATTVNLPEGNWDVYIDGKSAGTSVLSTATGSVSVEPISCMVLVKGGKGDNTSNESDTTKVVPNAVKKDPSHVGTIVAVVGVIVAFLAVILIMNRKNKKK